MERYEKHIKFKLGVLTVNTVLENYIVAHNDIYACKLLIIQEKCKTSMKFTLINIPFSSRLLTNVWIFLLHNNTTCIYHELNMFI